MAAINITWQFYIINFDHRCQQIIYFKTKIIFKPDIHSCKLIKYSKGGLIGAIQKISALIWYYADDSIISFWKVMKYNLTPPS